VHALVACRLGDLVEPWYELVALGRDELELLFDAETEGCALAERVLYDGTSSVVS
jgi:hypothetical protein